MRQPQTLVEKLWRIRYKRNLGQFEKVFDDLERKIDMSLMVLENGIRIERERELHKTEINRLVEDYNPKYGASNSTNYRL